MAKGWFEKFGGFTISFAEITVENELGNRSPLATEPESADNLSPCREKVKSQSGNLSTFFYISARVLALLRDRERGNDVNPACSPRGCHIASDPHLI